MKADAIKIIDPKILPVSLSTPEKAQIISNAGVATRKSPSVRSTAVLVCFSMRSNVHSEGRAPLLRASPSTVGLDAMRVDPV
jgi:hypothetical protein